MTMTLTPTPTPTPPADELVDWRMRGLCRDRPELFITPYDGDDAEHPEPTYPDPRAKAICDMCPVRPECLEWALANDEYGTWGGTSRFQREQIRRRINRATCPSCQSDVLAAEHGQEICLACGISWPAPYED